MFADVRSETRLGYVDLKTMSVHFCMRRNGDYSKESSAIAWNMVQSNIGNAMNPASGVFTAPRDGVYHFHFSGMSSSVSHFTIYLRLNGQGVGRARASNSRTSASIHSTLKLKKGDAIDLFLFRGSLYGGTDDYSHFTGWLDEEDIQIK